MTTLYKKVGRRYRPVAEHEEQARPLPRAGFLHAPLDRSRRARVREAQQVARHHCRAFPQPAQRLSASFRGERMTPTETAALLRQFMDWRRDKSNWPPSPMQIEKAIDAAIEMIERMGKMEAALQIAMRQNSHDMLMTGDELRQCEAAMEKSK